MSGQRGTVPARLSRPVMTSASRANFWSGESCLRLVEKFPYSRRGRAAALIIALAAAGSAAAVKFLIRPAAAEAGIPLLTVAMGSLPDLFAAVAIPFGWTVAGYRILWPLPRWRFAANAFWGWVILLNNELWQLREANEHFDAADVGAAAAGAAIAVLLYRTTVDPASRNAPRGDGGSGVEESSA